MDDNQFEGSELFQKEDIPKEEENSGLVNIINELSNQNPIISTINISCSSGSLPETLNNFKEGIIESKIPYLNQEEIPELKIKDIIFQKKIDNYLKPLLFLMIKNLIYVKNAKNEKIKIFVKSV